MELRARLAHPANEQLAAELAGVLAAVRTILPEVPTPTPRRVARAAARRLVEGDAELGAALVRVLFAGEPPAGWWASPAGMLVAAAVAGIDDAAISRTAAAAALGWASASSISSLIARGQVRRAGVQRGAGVRRSDLLALLVHKALRSQL